MNYIINIGEWKIIFDQVVRDFKNLTVVDINRDEVEQAIYKYLIEQCSKKKGFQQEECCDSINIDTLFTVLDGEHFKSRSLLHLAIQCVHLQMVKLLIMSGIQVNLCGDDHSLIRNPDTHGFIHGDGWTPLHEAVVMDTSTLKNSKAKKAIVEILISSKADINRKYIANKRTPLHELCAKNNNSKNDAHVAEVLIKSGANLNLVDLTNKTPYNIACERGNTKIIEIFNDTKTQLLNPPIFQLTNTQTTKVCKEKHNKCSIIM